MGSVITVPRLLYWSIGGLVLLLAFWLGGWPWALLWALSFVLQARVDISPAAAVTAAGGAIFWIVLFHWTGDRRLFFPYAMQVGQASSPVILAAVFFAIRIQQSATPHVLTVELLAAAAILAAGYAIQRLGPPGLSTRIIAAAAASILALASLLL